MVQINLYNGDCLEIIKKISDKSIDCIITDPPYLHVKGGMKSKVFNVGKTWSADSYMNNNMSDFDEKHIFEFLDAVKPKMKKLNMYIFCSKLQLIPYFKWIDKNKAKYDLLIWDKEVITMKSTKFFTSDIEYVVRIYENGVSLNKIVNQDNKAISNYYTKKQTYKKPKGNHETMKPIELLEKYILLSSNENEIVLDPFMGSGSTGVACKKLNRNFIGIELNTNYFNITKERINESN